MQKKQLGTYVAIVAFVLSSLWIGIAIADRTFVRKDNVNIIVEDSMDNIVERINETQDRLVEKVDTILDHVEEIKERIK